ncbi:MAG: TauD/TfdA family dioxygenase [Pseudomonadota bacterium]|nr:TauD/TfdA family dioxygenase [Pseudomonadota bacterium]
MSVAAATVHRYETLKATPITGGIGAEISGVDLRDLSDGLIVDPKRVWLDYKVLFFREQKLTQAEHVAYGRALGELEVHPFTPNDSQYPEIIILHSRPENFFAAQTWHSDVTFRACPPLGSILYGRIIPTWGGDTCFANMELAYDLLSDEIKEDINGLNAVHSLEKTFAQRMDDEQREGAFEAYPDQVHPIVRSHPETGNKSIFVNVNFTLYVQDRSEEESSGLLNKLYDQAAKPEVQCRFRWHAGSVAQWDNRCTQHYAVPDYVGEERRVERVTLVGDRPR